jgi:hypothetical protein
MDWEKRSAYVFIRCAKGKVETIWKKIQTWSHAIGSWIVSGEWDIITWLDAQSWDDVYKWTSEIRSWEGVEYTSSHLVYRGYKNGGWWWKKPAGTWTLIRGGKMDGDFDKLKSWNWITSAVSIPGNWDYLLWLEGDSWNEVWEHVMTLCTQEHWDTLTHVPVKSWWNDSWEHKWW